MDFKVNSEIFNHRIYEYYGKEFAEFVGKYINSGETIDILYKKFIKLKNIGVLSVSFLNNKYIIVDEQKWLLSQLKFFL